jgi:hypothetical protein
MIDGSVLISGPQSAVHQAYDMIRLNRMRRQIQRMLNDKVSSLQRLPPQVRARTADLFRKVRRRAGNRNTLLSCAQASGARTSHHQASEAHSLSAVEVGRTVHGRRNDRSRGHDDTMQISRHRGRGYACHTAQRHCNARSAIAPRRRPVSPIHATGRPLRHNTGLSGGRRRRGMRRGQGRRASRATALSAAPVVGGTRNSQNCPCRISSTCPGR